MFNVLWQIQKEIERLREKDRELLDQLDYKSDQHQAMEAEIERLREACRLYRATVFRWDRDTLDQADKLAGREWS